MKHALAFLFAALFFGVGAYVLYHSHATRHVHELGTAMVCFCLALALAAPASARSALGAVADAVRGLRSAGGAAGGAP
ncbi:MAG TPA: hypothetical protein VEA99_08235 [Gemmatimonadaceae bacterium]|nr:hypothetical protein [Gemmatimonadaceae bacterium]